MRFNRCFLHVITLLGISVGLTQGCKSKQAVESQAVPEESLDELRKLAKWAKLEKTQLKFGFIKLTDCAPLIIAKEKGFFSEEGLNVEVEAQANWKILFDRVVSGELDGAHMLPGQAIGAAIGFGTETDIVAPFAMGLNTLAVTVSNDIWAQMKKSVPHEGGKPVHPVRADVLRPIVKKVRSAGKQFPMGTVFPTSTHNYLLRYWLAAGGLNPGFYTKEDSRGVVDADVLISVTPPPQMPSTMEAGTIFGYSVGEPWNQQAVVRGIGVPVVTAYHIWKRTPEKVFGMRKDWAERHPNTVIATTKALLRAAQWLDAEEGKNRTEAARILSKPEFVGADYEVIVGPLTGVYQYERGDTRPLTDSNVYFRNEASYPFYSDAIWYLTQMRRWGQVPESKPDSWYHEIARKVYLPEIYKKAARALVEEGKMSEADVPWDSDGYRPPANDFIDGVEYDGRRPTDYIARLKVGLKDEPTN